MNCKGRGIALAWLLGAGLMVLVSACQGDANTNMQNNGGTVYAESAIGTIAGAASMGDSSAAVAFLPAAGTRGLWERMVESASLVRTAYAAMTCGTFTFTGATASSVDIMPPTCTDSATGASVTWSGGPWHLAFNLVGCATVTHALVNSGCGVSTSLTRTATTPITRTIAVGGVSYAVTQDTNTASGWVTPKSGGITITCVTVTLCPALSDTGNTRRIDMSGTHIVGSVNGMTVWDHTVYTSTGITITGAGANRVINSGTIVTEHNIARVTTTTTVTVPLTHMAGCPFPVSGSIQTTLSGGPFNGRMETITFTGTCGTVNITRADGTTGQAMLRNAM